MRSLTVKELTSRRNVNNYEEWKKSLKKFIVGWVNYYKLADTETYLKDIDEWMRRRIVWRSGEMEKGTNEKNKPAKTRSA